MNVVQSTSAGRPTK